MALYDSIGHGYGERRRQDPRIAEPILSALRGAETIVNVGAGAGSYEPSDRPLVAVEPSQVMIRQRASTAPPAVCATATDLPFPDRSFDASLAILTIHHWPDVARGLAELRRVARGNVVVLTFDTSVGGFWLTDYFPGILEVDRRSMPTLATIEEHLGTIRVVDVPIPRDCTDGLLGAHWARPEAYLEERVRSAMSVFSQIDGVEAGSTRLRADLDSGAWHDQHGHLLDRPELDLGYRLVVAETQARMTGPGRNERLWR